MHIAQLLVFRCIAVRRDPTRSGPVGPVQSTSVPHSCQNPSLNLIRKDFYTTVPVVTLGAKYNTQVGKKIEEREVCERQSLSSHPQCLLLIGLNRPI